MKYENVILELSEEKRKEFYRDIIEVIYISDYEYHIIFKHPFMMVQEVYCEPKIAYQRLEDILKKEVE